MYIYLADFEDGYEKKAFSSLKKACEWAKAKLQKTRENSCDETDESHIIRTEWGMTLQIKNQDGQITAFTVEITKMKVE